ncbi:hypothetical protein ES702_07683 [subsurface metagenome]
MEQGQVSFADHLKNFGLTMLRGLKDIAIKEGAKIEAVQKEVEAQKLVMSKELLWKIFPFVVVIGLTLWLIGRFK